MRHTAQNNITDTTRNASRRCLAALRCVKGSSSRFAEFLEHLRDEDAGISPPLLNSRLLALAILDAAPRDAPSPELPARTPCGAAQFTKWHIACSPIVCGRSERDEA